VLAAARRAEFRDHGVVDEIGAALHGWQHSTAPGYRFPQLRCFTFWSESSLSEGRFDEICAVLETVQHGPSAEALNLIVAMMNVARELLAGARINAELRRSGSGIDGEYTARRLICRVRCFRDRFRSHVGFSRVLQPAA
jgi:hypothetical protein